MSKSNRRVLTKIQLILVVTLACTLLSCVNVAANEPVAAPAKPFPQHVKYAPGTILPNHRTQAQLDNDVRAYYDEWKAQYLVEVSDNPLRYRIEFSKDQPERTVSEGQGYGMLIVAIMAGHDPDAQEIFDGLWTFVRDHPSKIDERLMAWQIPESDQGEDSAFDGDADIAYALLLADAQWGSSGAVNYASEAQTVITAIKESTFGPDSHLPTLGDWVDINGVATEANQYTPRSSDFMTAHFRAYGRSSGDSFWGEAVSAVQETITSLQTNHSPNTGLLPDFIEPVSAQDHTPRPADPGFLEAPTDGDYYYNAGRDPWRLGTDALLNNDLTSLTQVQRMADWIASSTGQDPMKIAPGYHLDGTLLPGDQYFTIFFAAPFGVALMTRPSQQAFLNDLYDAVYQSHEAYYEDSVTLLSLLVITGNYWDPTTGAQVGTPLYLPLILDPRVGS